MKIKLILTGATGMVGEGVLHECLQHDDVEEILVVGRKTCGITHPKLKEIIHPDFYYLASIENQLSGYNACFFCLGVSSIGMKEAEFYKPTYLLTMNFATTLVNRNPGMTFCYISGAGTDSTEKGKTLGLLGMKERVHMMHGKLEIKSAPGKGTSVRIAVPLKEHATH